MHLNYKGIIIINLHIIVILTIFIRSLGPRSRFGDGDGSFWDQWINTEMPSKGLGVDEKGLPISG